VCYFDKLFSKPRASINTICHAIGHPRFDRPDLLVGTGSSGQIPIMAVAMQIRMPFAIVRKSGETTRRIDEGGCHSTRRVEPFNPIDSRYIIIDDTICTGGTIQPILKGMGRQNQCVGIILYQAMDRDWYHNPCTCERIPVVCVEEDIVKVDKLYGWDEAVVV